VALFETDCQEVLQRIELYLDGELGDEHCMGIEIHLSGCGSCMHRLEFRREVRSLIRRKCGQEAVPPEVVERIRRAIGSV